MPNSTIFGDANGDGLFDDRNALLGLNVQKYGRTTKLTHGQITGINATVTICYGSFRIHLHEDGPLRRPADHLAGWVQQRR